MEVPYQAWLFARMIQRYLPMGHNDRIFITRKAIEKEGLNIDEMNFAFSYLKGQGVIYDHESKEAIWIDEEDKNWVRDDPDDRYHDFSVRRDPLEDLIHRGEMPGAEKRSSFDEKTSTLKVGNFVIPIPPYNNEFYFCKTMFKHPLNYPIDWEEVYLEMTGDEWVNDPAKAHKKIYDALRALNTRVKESTKGRIEKLFSWKLKTAKRLF